MSGITELLDIESSEYVDDQTSLTLSQEHTPDDEIDQALKRAQEDYELARRTLADIVKKNMTVLEVSSIAATSTENSDQFSAYAKLADSTTKAAKELMSINRDLIAMTPTPKQEQLEAEGSTNITNNILFTGTTTELLALLNQKQLPAIDV